MKNHLYWRCLSTVALTLCVSACASTQTQPAAAVAQDDIARVAASGDTAWTPGLLQYDQELARVSIPDSVAAGDALELSIEVFAPGCDRVKGLVLVSRVYGFRTPTVVLDPYNARPPGPGKGCFIDFRRFEHHVVIEGLREGVVHVLVRGLRYENAPASDEKVFVYPMTIKQDVMVH